MEKLKLYLAVTPAELPTVSRCAAVPVHMAYAVGSDAHLMYSGLPQAVRGGLMGLSAAQSASFRGCGLLVRSIAQECELRRFGGVFADFTCPADEDSFAFLAALLRVLSRAGKKLFVPEPFALSGCTVLLGTALSGGTLRERLCDAAARWGSDALALDCERVIMDFPVPCRSGIGQNLSPEQLSVLSKRCGSASFFSRELCANYFTYAERMQLHFVQFDTVQTLHYKLRLGEELGIRSAFFMFPEVKDLLGTLFPTVGAK